MNAEATASCEQPSAGPESLPRGMVLAAGYGKRFRPLTLVQAKPTVPFLNRPLIEYSLELFRTLKLQEIVINLHHAPETVQSVVADYFSVRTDDWQPEIHYSREEAILGTAGGIGKAREWLEGADVIVSNGKVFLEEDLSAALREHRRRGSFATLLLKPHDGHEPYNPVIMDAECNIRGFCLKSEVKSFENAYIFTGVQLISSAVLSLIKEGYSESVKDLYPELMRMGHPVRGFVSESLWYECSWPERYLRNTFDLLGRRGMRNLLASAVEGDFDAVVAGRNVCIGRNCVLRNVILMDNVSVGPESSLTDVIISSGSEVPPCTDLRNAVLTPALNRVPEDMAAKVGVLREGCLIWPLK